MLSVHTNALTTFSLSFCKWPSRENGMLDEDGQVTGLGKFIQLSRVIKKAVIGQYLPPIKGNTQHPFFSVANQILLDLNVLSK